MIIESTKGSFFWANCYIVGSEATGEGMVVDPGEDGPAILEKIGQTGLVIKVIVATHGHSDHLGAARMVKEATGAQFVIHAAAFSDPMMGAAEALAELWGFSFDLPPDPDLTLSQGDTISVGDLSFTVLETPGHAPGSISIYGHGVVFTGDVLARHGIGRTDFPGCSYEQLLESIHTQLLTLPDDTIVLAGHGSQTTIGEERRNNPFLQ